MNLEQAFGFMSVVTLTWLILERKAIVFITSGIIILSGWILLVMMVIRKLITGGWMT